MHRDKTVFSDEKSIQFSSVLIFKLENFNNIVLHIPNSYSNMNIRKRITSQYA